MPKEPPTVLGQHLRKRRLELGLSIPKLARQLGISAWVVDAIERKGSIPNRASYQKIVAFLGYDPMQGQASKT